MIWKCQCPTRGAHSSAVGSLDVHFSVVCVSGHTPWARPDTTGINSSNYFIKIIFLIWMNSSALIPGYPTALLWESLHLHFKCCI